MSGSRTRARRYAVQGLYQWQVTGQDLAEIESQFFAEQGLKGVDIDYFRHLLHEVPAHLTELDEVLAPHLDRPLKEVDLVERAVLRIGAYELVFGDDIPFRVVINEAVELAKKFGAESGHKYVNGVLDKVARHAGAEPSRA